MFKAATSGPAKVVTANRLDSGLVVFLDPVTDLDVPRDDFRFGDTFADIGQVECELAHGVSP